MRLINSSYSIEQQEEGLQGIYKSIERAGRTAWKSEENIKEDSAERFVKMLMNKQHLSVLEFGTVYMKMPITTRYSGDINPYLDTPYAKVVVGTQFCETDIYGDICCCYYITTNYRFIIENELLDDLNELSCEPTEFHEKRVNVRFIVNIIIHREIVRHRHMSFCGESTRYCNYNNDRFNRELTFIIPSWLELPEDTYIEDLEGSNRFYLVKLNKLLGYPEKYYDPNNYLHGITQIYDLLHSIPSKWEIILDYLNGLHSSEEGYFQALINNLKPEEARDLLPLATKSELCVCGFESDWKHFFELRCDKTAHPDIRRLAIPLREELLGLGYKVN